MNKLITILLSMLLVSCSEIHIKDEIVIIKQELTSDVFKEYNKGIYTYTIKTDKHGDVLLIFSDSIYKAGDTLRFR